MDTSHGSAKPGESHYSAAVPLEVDEGAGQLSLNPEAEITADTKLIAWQQDFLKWGIKAETKNISQGQHDGVPAALVIFRFSLNLESASGLGRVSEAKINVKAIRLSNPEDTSPSAHTDPANSDALNAADKDVASSGSEGILAKFWRSLGFGQTNLQDAKPSSKPAMHCPQVAVICPKYLHGESSTEQISYNICVSAGEYITPYVERGVSRNQEYKIKARGERWFDEETGSANLARWILSENQSQGTGVPTDFNCGVLYQHAGKPFQLSVEVRLRTKTGLHLFGRPWTPLLPVIIREDTRFGKSATPSSFDNMTVDEWKTLCEAKWCQDDDKYA